MTARADQVKKFNWRTTAEFVGISAVVGSLIFVGFQIQLDRQVAISQVNMAAMEARIAIETTMAENVDVWLKAANLEDLNESEVRMVEHLTRMSSSKAYFETMADNRVIGQMTFPKTVQLLAHFLCSCLRTLAHEESGCSMPIDKKRTPRFCRSIPGNINSSMSYEVS